LDPGLVSTYISVCFGVLSFLGVVSAAAGPRPGTDINLYISSFSGRAPELGNSCL